MRSSQVTYSNSVRAFAVIFLMSIATVSAQVNKQKYFGLQGALGDRVFVLKSDVEELSQLRVLAEGGYAGLITGNDKFQFVGRVGLLYSASRVSRSIDLQQADAQTRIFPLAFFKAKNPTLCPYIVAGVGFTQMKFFGHYLKDDPSQNVNYSGAEPYIGMKRTLSLQSGLGISYRFRQYDFVEAFVEMTMGHSLRQVGDNAFAGTTSLNESTIQIGVSFGFER